MFLWAFDCAVDISMQYRLITSLLKQMIYLFISGLGSYYVFIETIPDCLGVAGHSVFSKWSCFKLHPNTYIAAVVYFTQCIQAY